MTPAQRERAALFVKRLGDVTPWPELKWFNSEPCERHAPELNILCSRCGIRLRRHQRVGAAWMYLGIPGLLADTFGSGKTAQVAAMLAMCKETGELGLHNRAVIICKAAAVGDPWARELQRLVPGISVFIADGDRDSRVRGYMGNWEVAVVSDRTFAPAGGQKRARDGDVAYLREFPVGMLVYDDIDPMRNNTTRTAQAINSLAATCTRVVGAHATPLQKRLTELWCFLEPVGGRKRLGSLETVKSRYVTVEGRWITVADKRDPTGRRTVQARVYDETGITRNPRRIAEFRRGIAPLVLRRTAGDLDDVELPEIQLNPVFLDLSPRQRARYNELRAGALRRVTEDGERVALITPREAAATFTRGWQICSGLAALDTGPGADDSVKLDWAMDAITGDFSDEKVVTFVYFRQNLIALSRRLTEAGIAHVLMWSGETDKRERARRLTRFREDPDCQVLVGTTTIEASLNLQVSRHLIAVDTILNPARMGQLAGRVRRQGSPYPMVFLHQLLARQTQEDAYLAMLRREAEMADVVWDEKSEIYTALTPRQLMGLVATGRLAA
jgi:SNF2 family DNA or RNA helicase